MSSAFYYSPVKCQGLDLELVKAVLPEGSEGGDAILAEVN